MYVMPPLRAGLCSARTEAQKPQCPHPSGGLCVLRKLFVGKIIKEQKTSNNDCIFQSLYQVEPCIFNAITVISGLSQMSPGVY